LKRVERILGIATRFGKGRGESMAEKRPEKRRLDAFLRDAEGATAIEYGILMMMVGLALLGMVSLSDVSNQLDNTFNTISNTLSG